MLKQGGVGDQTLGKHLTLALYPEQYWSQWRETHT